MFGLLNQWNLTTKQAAAKFGYHENYLRKLARDQVIPAKKKGNRWLFSEKAFEKWVNKNTDQYYKSLEENELFKG